SRPVHSEPRPCLIDVGFPLSGPQDRTSTSDLNDMPGTRASPDGPGLDRPRAVPNDGHDRSPPPPHRTHTDGPPAALPAPARPPARRVVHPGAHPGGGVAADRPAAARPA